MRPIVHRRHTRRVKVGDLVIGGNDVVFLQSMCTTKTTNIDDTIAQIEELTEAGCQLVRVAVPDMEAAKCLGAIKAGISIPLVADIHFDYRLALEAITQGVDKIRLNPGNIVRADRVKKVVFACKEKGIPIRIGINAASLEKKYLEKEKFPTALGMVNSALDHIHLLEELDFQDIIVSLKASNVPLAIEAYELASRAFDYPLHLGITEAGAMNSGTIKSAAGLGALLQMGLGSTARVSLSANPVKEIRVLRTILQAYGLANNAATLISCPTCGRIQIDLIPIAQEIERYIEKIRIPIKVAVMGCAVNGPGEAREADIGVAGSNGKGMLFKKGEIIKTVPEEMMLEELKTEIDKMCFEILEKMD
ncbi:MAG: flavodoxin-dependent (E)-4-hydroxy-3-methylbut-2-enyl-diphosphate synthase [Lactobacillales bacterium]|nr:flavodoxin-dependent (E)-4-hydroxy-3-methylbut-2-enyl-diphosphate synthase [Lactobacillales bacterium]